jgi:hypothetical protein
MSRCTRTRNLEIHHRSVTGGAGVSNAKVLCQKCHAETLSYGSAGHKSPPELSDTVKAAALKNAANRCECERVGCHS